MMMRLCKVKGCNRKHDAKGYCKAHWHRWKRGLPFQVKCKQCKSIIKVGSGRWHFCSDKCSKQYLFKRTIKWYKDNKESFVSVSIAGRRSKVYVNGVKEEIKPLIPEIKNKVFEDCIKNPRKYLD